ncbi:MAG TPA: amidohydrolase family protein [Tepidisphaeraceae bacterium]|nr:amidohydrolase family protein [Tepidisphaeraceae bacterium]
MRLPTNPTRRQILGCAAVSLAASLVASAEETPATQPAEPIIDIHQHTHYSGRTDEQLLRHQRAMSVTQTILLPAGSVVKEPATHEGKSNGLAATCGGNQSVLDFSRANPREYLFFANEVPDLPTARDELSKYLKLGALGIGEQKFNLDCDSPPIELVATVAREFGVPVLLHFQEGMYNKGFANFHKILEKFPQVNFIGHAQSFWAFTDKNYSNFKDTYPHGKVTPGGVTDRYLTEYPNMYADMSAGSGLNFLLRDEDHARAFLDRHQDKCLFGSDCNDSVGRGPTCQGWMTIHTLKRVAPSKAVERKILYENAKKLFKL